MRLIYSCITCILLTILGSNYVMSMSREQLQSSTKLLKMVCAPKSNVTEEEVGEMRFGKFIEKRNVMCYVACLYRISQLIKDNQIIHDIMIKQVYVLYPDEMKEAVAASINGCRPVAKNYEDICEASYYTAKCIYDYDPSVFVFP